MRNSAIIIFVMSALVINAFAQTPQNKNKEFYIINVVAVKTEDEAKAKATSIKNDGTPASYLWIPDYPSLGNAQYYAVFIGPFFSQQDCERATEKYRKKNPKVYGLMVSQEKKRVEIPGIGKVKVTYLKTIANTEAMFVIKTNKGLAEGDPSSDISLSYGKKLIFLSKIAGQAQLINKKDYNNYSIPENAVSACGAWWAGAGDYFFLTQSNKSLVIYRGWQDEYLQNQGYHWKKIKEIGK